VTFHGLRAEVQRFGLVLPPLCVGRCNGGRDRDFAMEMPGCANDKCQATFQNLIPLTHHCNLEIKPEISIVYCL
jgi:hypothetical protein